MISTSAEEATHEAFATAIQQWPKQGIPANPLCVASLDGRFKAIDVIRRRALLMISNPSRARLSAEIDRLPTNPWPNKKSRTIVCG